MEQCAALHRQNHAFSRTFWTRLRLFSSASIAIWTCRFQIVRCNHHLRSHLRFRLVLCGHSGQPSSMATTSLKMQKTPVTKGRGSRGTTFINRINDSLGTYGKGTVSPFDTLLLITERTSRLRLLPVSAKRFRSPFGIRRASVHTSHRLS